MGQYKKELVEIQAKLIRIDQMISGIVQYLTKKESILVKSYPLSNGEIYNNQTLSQKLGLCQKTLKKYRDEGLINYSQYYDKCYYSQKDVEEFLARSHTQHY